MAKGRQVYLGSEKGLPAVLWRGAKFPLLRYVWYTRSNLYALRGLVSGRPCAIRDASVI